MRSFSLAVIPCLLAPALVTQAAATRPESANSEPVVSLSAGASLTEALAALQRASGMLVLSEKPQVDRTLEHPVEARPLSVALDEVSRSFHLYCLRRPRALEFQRRYVDPREMPDLELEEIAAVTGDLYHLVHAVCPYTLDETSITDQNDFCRSLQKEQLQAMQTDGLPLARLTPPQQALWMKINTVQGYAAMSLDLERVARLYSSWKRADLSYLTRPTREPGGLVTNKTLLWLRWPSPAEAEGIERVEMPEQGSGVTIKLPVASAVAILAPRPRALPSGFSRTVTGTEGEVTLRALLAPPMLGQKVSIPDYAAKRTLLVFTSGHSAAELLQGIEDLYGWKLHEETGARWSIGRVSPGITRDPRELFLRMQAALPVCAYRLWDREAEISHAPRYLTQWSLIRGEITKALGDGWQSVQLQRLEPPTQRSLANLMLDRQVRAAVQGFTQRPLPQWWLIEPEKGYFTLDGETGPGKHPLMEFRVQRPDGKIDAWGWGVGTSSLEN